MGSSQIEEFLKADSGSQNFQRLVESKNNELTEEIKGVIKNDMNSKYLGKAILACMKPPYTPFEATREAVRQNAWDYGSEYRDEYQFPGMIAKNLDEEPLVKRIWYALMKQGLVLC